jgi:hypothetical protein
MTAEMGRQESNSLEEWIQRQLFYCHSFIDSNYVETQNLTEYFMGRKAAFEDVLKIIRGQD